jgi:hypothetical protein
LTALVCVARALLDGNIEGAEGASLQDMVKAARALPQIVIYPGEEIVTLDPAKPAAQAVAVAVVRDQILAVEFR